MAFAIIGLGKMGKFYDALLNAKYLVDSFPIPNRIYFSSVDEFIFYKQPVDMVIVATPTYTHFEIVEKLLKNGYNVLCEKPICVSSFDAKRLEALAAKKHLLIYQSTLERYNPVIKFLMRNIPKESIAKIVSYRFGAKPSLYYSSDPKFDLGIHDIDLWFHLFKRQLPWNINVGYGKPRREIFIYLKNDQVIRLDLLNKFIIYNGEILNFAQASSNNPILEMVYDLMYAGVIMNEKWSEEIKVLERPDIINVTQSD